MNNSRCVESRRLKDAANNSCIEHILINYRWVFVLLLLPISCLYDLYYYLRSWLVFYVNSAPEQHYVKVNKVQEQVREWFNGDKTNFMCTARPGWQTVSFREPAYKKTFNKINIDLVDVIFIDTEKQIVRCEPLVTMGQLSQTLIRNGWTIAVVPEIDDLTVGGLVMGTGIESSSHKYGLFQHICTCFELVLCDGSLVTCTEETNSDLFYSIPWSYGTLGFLTAVDIKIIPALRYIKLTYQPCHSHEDFIASFTNASSDSAQNEYVEGLMYSIDSGVVMTGQMTDLADSKQINKIGRWYKPWFFKHVQNILENKETVTEYVPLRDYFHRHTKALFWELQDIVPFGNNAVFRYLFGWLMPPKLSLLKLTQGKTIKKLYEENHFIQDMLIPVQDLTKALQMFHKEVKIYPVWLCPFLLLRRPGMLRCDQSKDSLFVDIGTYGTPDVNDFNPITTTRRVEKFVRDLKGFQMMYADSYMKLEEYREMFDHSLYDKVRSDLQCCEAFPEVYYKVNRSARL